LRLRSFRRECLRSSSFRESITVRRAPILGLNVDLPAMTMTTTTETTPLLPRERGGNGVATKSKSWLQRMFHVENRILFAGFLITLSFSYTQVP
jgi:hypothetical protein